MPAIAAPELEEVREGTTTFWVPRSDHQKGPKAKQGVPFYNPAMRLSRDVSVLLLGCLDPPRGPAWSVCDAMTALGARGLRLAHEVPNVHVLLNDVNLDAIHLAKRNADRLQLQNADFRLGRLEPLLAEQRFDWVDVDPFGTPAPYLDLAAASVTDGGVLAITATDKAALCGVYPHVCLRRYNAQPLHGPLMWEVGTRILLAAVARSAGRRDRWIEPLLAHSTQHYMRVYARVRDGAAQADAQAHSYAYAWTRNDLFRGLSERPPPDALWAGPLWGGPLLDPPLVDRMRQQAQTGFPLETQRFLERVLEEADAPPLYYTLDEFTERYKTNAPRLTHLLERLREAGHPATRTHFTSRGFKTTAPPTLIREFFTT